MMGHGFIAPTSMNLAATHDHVVSARCRRLQGPLDVLLTPYRGEVHRRCRLRVQVQGQRLGRENRRFAAQVPHRRHEDGGDAVVAGQGHHGQDAVGVAHRFVLIRTIWVAGLDGTPRLDHTIEHSMEVPMDAVTTSIRMPREVRDQFETLAQATGRTRNDLMVDALRVVAELQLREIALIQEGLEQARAGRTIAVEDVVAEFKRDGLLPADFRLEAADDEESATA
jgi:predicted transcriptional regulator